MGRRDPAFLTSFLYFFSFFSHFLDAETICFDVIFMLMSSSWRETRWPMVAWLFGVRKSAGGVLSVEHFSQRAAAVFARCGRSGSNAAVALCSSGPSVS